MRRLSILIVLFIFVGCNVARDQKEALAVASRVHSQMQAGDLSAIYRETTTGFKAATTESQFISVMQQIKQENGILKKANAVAYQTGVDSMVGRTHILLFDLEYEQRHLEERLTLTRSDDDRMRLWKIEWKP
jgi:hypothetical protein